jgi:hypothetical protein
MIVVLMPGLVGFVLGCSGQQNAAPVDKAAGKEIAADMKTAAQELKAERAQAKKEGASTKEMMKGRRKNRGGP